MFELKIATDNAAFGEDESEAARECARILRELADRLDSDLWNRTETVRDINGNRVGSFKLVK
jgi:hypothetical protein